MTTTGRANGHRPAPPVGDRIPGGPRYDEPWFPGHDRGFDGFANGRLFDDRPFAGPGYDHRHPADRRYPPGPPPFGPPAPPPLPPAPVRAGRRRLPLVVGAGAALAALATVAVLLVDVRQAPPQAATAAAPAPEFLRPLPIAPVRAPAPSVAASIAVPMVRGTLPVGTTPGHLEIAPNGRFAIIAHRGAGVVSVFDTTINKISATVPIPAGPPRFVSFSPDSKRAYISIYNEERTINLVGVLDTTTNTLLGTVPVGRRPFASATTPDGSQLWVPSHDDGRLDIIDTASGTLLTSVPVAPNPHWVAFSDDGTRAYVANHESNVVTVMDSATMAPLTTIPVGTSPHSTAVAAGHRRRCGGRRGAGRAQPAGPRLRAGRPLPLHRRRRRRHRLGGRHGRTRGHRDHPGLRRADQRLGPPERPARLRHLPRQRGGDGPRHHRRPVTVRPGDAPRPDELTEEP